jgi:23S rRNA (cytidine1920-2'-O)/16S rRNA (cytidine1409-2'-O)-methyltransferase
MASRSGRLRLDELLVQRGLAPSREQAKALVLSGNVIVPGTAVPKPGMQLREDCALSVAPARPYVSRGGVKLAHALDRFDLDPEGWCCADLGASTGGFTDCLLQRSASKVYAVDVGYGQLDWRLRQDRRVVVLERTNARYLEALPEQVELVTIDASFISLRLLLPTAVRIAVPNGHCVALVKPQFEAGKGRVGKGGVVHDPAVHREVLDGFATWLRGQHLGLQGIVASPIRGPAGNVEFLAHIRLGDDEASQSSEMIDVALAEAAHLADTGASDG